MTKTTVFVKFTLDSRILKHIAHHITTPLTHIINLSLKNGIFPKSYKLSTIVPIFKKGNKKELGNYRPIALQINFSKILEKIVKTRLEEYLTKNNKLTDKQYGFRKKIGTEDALLDLTSHLYTNIDQGKKVIAVFLDISKAYDSIKHSTLLTQLTQLGIQDTVHKWFHSYLTDRTQQLRLNSQLSDVKLCHAFSIPQGTILGPCLFNCYINDLPGISKGQVFCYADDAVICYTSNSWEETHRLATSDLHNILTWYTNMTLQLNFTKTNYITFSIDDRGQPRNSTLQIPDIDNNIITIQRQTTIRYLGVIIDKNLKWTDHILLLKSKLRSLIYIFNNIRNICNQNILREVYFAMAQSLLQYGITSWGSAYNNILNKLKTTQNILLRTILNKNRFYQSKELYTIFNVQTLHEIYIYKIATFSIKKKEQWPTTQHTYNTRQTGHARLTRIHTSLARKHFSYLGIKIFNAIPEEIKILTDIKLIRFKLKEWLDKEEVKKKIDDIIK